MTNQRLYSVYFALEDKLQNKAFAHYDNFWIDDEFNKYTLHISGYRGTAGKSPMRFFFFYQIQNCFPALAVQIQ